MCARNYLDLKSWNDLDSETRAWLIPFIGEAKWADDWEKSFVRKIWEGSEDGADLAPLEVAIMNHLVRCAVTVIVNSTTRRPIKAKTNAA